MRSGWNVEMRFDKRALSRMSQCSNMPPTHKSSGSVMPSPSTEQPAPRQCFARTPPMNPAAPVIMTFIVDSRVEWYFRLVQHVPAYPARSYNAPEYQYRCTFP